MNVIDYSTITCNLKKWPFTDYIRLHEKCNRLQPITITPCLEFDQEAFQITNKSVSLYIIRQDILQ